MLEELNAAFKDFFEDPEVKALMNSIPFFVVNTNVDNMRKHIYNTMYLKYLQDGYLVDTAHLKAMDAVDTYNPPKER